VDDVNGIANARQMPFSGAAGPLITHLQDRFEALLAFCSSMLL